MASELTKDCKKNEANTIISSKCACCFEDISRGLPSARGRRILSGNGRRWANSAPLDALCAVSQDMATFFELFPKKEVLVCLPCCNSLLRISRMQERLRIMATDLAKEVSIIQNGVKPFVKQFIPFGVKRTTNRTRTVKNDDCQRIQLKVPLKEAFEDCVCGNGANEKQSYQADLVPEKKIKLQQEIQNIAENGYVKIKPKPTEPTSVPVRVVGFFQNSLKASESSGSSKDGDGSTGVPETMSSRAPEETGQEGSLETAASRVSGQSVQEEAQSNFIEIKPEHNRSTVSSLSCISETLHGGAAKETVRNESDDMVINRGSDKHHQEEIVSSYVKMEPESEKSATLSSLSDVKQMTVHVSHVMPLLSEEGSVIKQDT